MPRPIPRVSRRSYWRPRSKSSFKRRYAEEDSWLNIYEWGLTYISSSRPKELPKKPADAARIWNSEIANCRT